MRSEWTSWELLFLVHLALHITMDSLFSTCTFLLSIPIHLLYGIILPLQVEMCSYNVSQNCKEVLLLYIGSLLIWQIDLMKHVTVFLLISCCMEYGIPCLHFVCNMWYVGGNVQNCSKLIITLEGWDWIQISMRVEKSVSVCWTHGQAGAQRCGTPQLRVFSKCLYLYKAWC